jgi:GNAT superfamily N-acetyltransferase
LSLIAGAIDGDIFAPCHPFDATEFINRLNLCNMIPRYTIRQAHSSDVAKLPDIEREAASLFASHATALGFNPEGPIHVSSLETLKAAQELGRLWVALDSITQLVGFALVREIDGFAHLEEMDVLPNHGRKGIGAALLEAVCAWATQTRYPAVTLSTFRDIPWNGPFYSRHGFHVVAPEALSNGLACVVEIERRRGLRTDLRVIMRRNL